MIFFTKKSDCSISSLSLKFWITLTIPDIRIHNLTLSAGPGSPVWLSGQSYCKFTKTGLQQGLGTDGANC